jgi:ubiquinone/menaquinone biosynthesis C-methylase UbiE
MSGETLKNHARRESNGDYLKYFSGLGIDIGCGSAPLPIQCHHWDLPEGDATYMEGVEDNYYDWVYSSHCLEHLDSPVRAIENWWRILKPGGHLIVVVPDLYLYERGQWPSPNTKSHKQYFTMTRLMGLVATLQGAQVMRLQINDDHFNYNDHENDQTIGKAQAEIESIVKKQQDAFWITSG